MYALKDSPLIPSDDEQADMYLCMVEELRHYGYEQYEISNFSIPGYESRHNLKYWQLDDYMGFGPGAHSCIGRTRYSYVRDLDRYLAGVLHGEDMIDEYETIGDFERAAEYLMLGMRTVHGVSRAEYERLSTAVIFPASRSSSRSSSAAAGPSRTASAGTSRPRGSSYRTCSSASCSRHRPTARPSTTRG